MFRFKMHTKVMVAVLLLGQLIELNVNLCIALSIERSPSINRVKLYRQELEWPRASQLNTALVDANTGPVAIESVLFAGGQSGAQSNGGPDLPDEEQVVAARANAGVAVAPSRPTKHISQMLESTGNYEYFGEIFAGTPAQSFLVLFDISSSVFWLPSSECTTSSCIGRNKFNGNKSSSYKREDDKQALLLSYDDDEIQVNARLVRDRVSFAGLTLENQLFGEALELHGNALSRMPVDGIMGLGLGPGFVTSNQSSEALKNSCLSQEMIGEKFVNPLARLQQQGLLEEPIYSLYLNEENKDLNRYNSHNGELIFGEIIDEYYVGDHITYTPVTRANLWEFHLQGVFLRQSGYANVIERGCEAGCPAIVDTGTKLIGGHFADVDILNRQIGALPKADGLYRLAPCDMRMLPNLIFNIGGEEFELMPEEYIEQYKINDQVVECISALRVIDSERYPFWILGEYFLKHHYVVFDFGQKRLGFARSQQIDQEAVKSRLKRDPHYFGRARQIDI